MDIRFRKLKASEIDVRVGTVNAGGVSLLLYKDARCDMAILDESVGKTRWQRSHTRDNANCTVSIYDTDLKEWVSKEDTGTESYTEKEKGLASDSFKRACVNWGIGRELYTAPDMFISKEHLKGYSYDAASKKGKCFDSFRVADISYADDAIASVTIEVLQYGRPVYKQVFGTSVPDRPAVTSKPAPAASPKASETPTPPAKPAMSISISDSPDNVMSDDEVLLIGNCKGKKYGEVKDSPVFKSFINWIKTANTTYPNPDQQMQYTKLKAIAG